MVVGFKPFKKNIVWPQLQKLTYILPAGEKENGRTGFVPEEDRFFTVVKLDHFSKDRDENSKNLSKHRI